MDDVSDISSLTFIGSSEEEDNPFLGANFANVDQVEKKTAMVDQSKGYNLWSEPRVTRAAVNPPLVPSCRSAFSVGITEQRIAPGIQAHPPMQAN